MPPALPPNSRRKTVNPQLAKLCDFTALICKAPRIAKELCELTGIARETIDRYIEGFVSEGLIEKTGTRRMPTGQQADVYTWVERHDPKARCRVCGCAEPLGSPPADDAAGSHPHPLAAPAGVALSNTTRRG